MGTKFHGVSLKKDPASGWFHFGFLRLLHVLDRVFRAKTKSSTDEILPEWPDQWFDNKFDRGLAKFQDSFWKFDRAARNFHKRVEAIKPHRDSIQLDVIEEVTGSLADIPLFLDAMLIYLRIQADCLANVIPNLYGQRGLGLKQGRSRDSFRHHMKWFITKQKEFDPAYTSILEANCGWFEGLAGKKGWGLREVVIHGRGTYQIGWSTPESGEDLSFWAGLMGDSGFVEVDFVPTLKSIVFDYFIFLDHLYEHFSAMLEAKIGPPFSKASSEQSRYITFTGGPLSSFWLYPTIVGSGQGGERRPQMREDG